MVGQLQHHSVQTTVNSQAQSSHLTTVHLTMKSFTLHGPLAHAQRQVIDLQTQLADASKQTDILAKQLRETHVALAHERRSIELLEGQRLPELLNQIAGLQDTIATMQANAEHQVTSAADAAATAAAGLAALQVEQM
jgi:hypothetical protein